MAVRIQLPSFLLLVVRWEASRTHTAECIELRTRHRSLRRHGPPETHKQPRDSRWHWNKNGRRGRGISIPQG